MDEKQEKRIVYQGGVTRRTSDFLCQDGELAECINITADGEELKVIPELETKMTGLNGTLLYVHRYNDQERYIVLVPGSPNVVRWGTMASGNTYQQAEVYVPQEQIGGVIIAAHYEYDELFETTGDVKVTSIGKTLIFTTDVGLKYAIWEDDTYKVMEKIPELQFTAHIHTNADVVSSGSDDGLLTFNSSLPYFAVLPENQSDYNDLVYGLLAENKKKAAQAKGFVEPFFVMAAIQLYDGSYTMMTAPILIPASVTQHSYVRIKRAAIPASFVPSSENRLYMVTHYGQLWCRQLTDYSEWSDIVKDVVVFVSDGIRLYETGVDAVGSATDSDGTLTPISDSFLEAGDLLADSIIKNYLSITATADDFLDYYMARALLKRTDNAIKEDITANQPFYKLCKLGMQPFGSAENERNVSPQFDTHTLENITTQELLKTMEYFSHCSMQADVFYAYNSRLNIAGIKRGIFSGFNYFFPWENDNEGSYTAFVRIKTDSGNRIVKKTWRAKQKQGIWFYYPDPRAEWATIYKEYDNGQVHGQMPVLNAKLTEHPSLNGAYYYKGTIPVPSYTEGDGVDSTDAIPYATTPSVEPELLPNQLATSEVNNPFVFNASGYNTVGTGRILALSTQTQALSQGQFGQYPLLVFCDDGIWAMAVDATGLYQSIHPMSREVCINAGAIVQTDDAVLFVSKKGLMVINGREVTCVSTAMDGLPFNTQSNNVSCLNYENLDDQSQESAPWADIIDLAADATTFQTFLLSGVLHMAYDYIDARVMLFNSTYGYSWVCSMKDGGFTKQLLKKKILNVVNDYPDYLLQDGYGNLYTLYGKTREESVSTRRLGFLVTRPLKLSAPLTVSSIRELVNVGYWDKRDGYSVVRTLLIVSDDLLTWFPASSRFGAAAKYYRIALFVKMLPSERLSGTIIRLQDRRTNNLRK